MERGAELAEVAGTLAAAGGVADFGYAADDDRGQHADDRDDGQKFDEGERQALTPGGGGGFPWGGAEHKDKLSDGVEGRTPVFKLLKSGGKRVQAGPMGYRRAEAAD